MNQWHAVFCKPRGEETAEANLEKQGYVVYLPRLLNRFWRAGKRVQRIEPLFPRYLFLRQPDEGQSLAPVRSTLGVTGLVRFGGQPAVVSEELIEALRAREEPANGTRVHRVIFRPGVPVRFAEGPFAGLDAIFDKEAGADRVMVLLEMLGKTNRLQVDRGWIVPAG